MKERIGNRLREVRESHNLSQTELAEKLGMTQKAVSSWENDRTYPRMLQLTEMCKIYDCTLEYLTGTKQHDPHDITLDDILVKLWDMNEKELQKVKDNVETIIERNAMIRDIERQNNELMERVHHYEEQLKRLKQNNP